MKKLIPFLAAALMLAGCGKMTAGTYEPEDLSSQEDGLSSAGADLSSEPAEENGGVATDGEDTVQEDPAPVTADTGGIVLIYEYTNYAWGFVNNGYFIDSDGNVYGFDLPPAVSYTAKDVPLVEQLKMIKEFSEPALTVDKDTVSKMAGYGAACDPEADFDMELTAFDAGEGRYFFVSPDGETILCGESGDYTYTPKDEDMKKLLELWDGLWDGPGTSLYKVPYENYTALYTSERCYLTNIALDSTDIEGSFILSSPDEVEDFSQLTGIDLVKALDIDLSADMDLDRFMNEKKFCFMVSIGSSSADSPAKEASAFLLRDGVGDFAPGEDFDSPCFCKAAALQTDMDLPERTADGSLWTEYPGGPGS